MTKQRLLSALLTGVALACCTTASAQRVNWALKTNMLYDVTTSPNLGLEVGIGHKNTFQIFYGMNAWEFGKGEDHTQHHLKHWVVMPEYRWWTCTKFNGFFYGVHAFGGEFNAQRINAPVTGYYFLGGHQSDIDHPTKGNVAKAIRDGRVEGDFLGAGMTVGYQWILNRHWNLEAEVGAGYAHIWTNHYRCAECANLLHSGGTNYLGLTKLGVSILYVF